MVKAESISFGDVVNCVQILQGEMMQTHYLNSEKLLIDAFVDWLMRFVKKTSSGVFSFEHLLIVLPTRQSSRRLRFALAKKFQSSGCLPPEIYLPYQILFGKDSDLSAKAPVRLAISAKTLLEMDLTQYPNLFPKVPTKTFQWAMEIAQQFMELWKTLAENALTMHDVAEILPELLKDETADVDLLRWRELAGVEKIIFEKLLSAGIQPEPFAWRESVQNPTIPDGIEAVVLPGILDAPNAFYSALKNIEQEIHIVIHADENSAGNFDTFGRPITLAENMEKKVVIPLQDSQIHNFMYSSEESEAVANFFAGIPADEQLPSISILDNNRFPEMNSAFSKKNLTLHNPSTFPVKKSSLGKLILRLIALMNNQTLELIILFVRQFDVMKWLTAKTGATRCQILSQLDELRNSTFPKDFIELKTATEKSEKYNDLSNALTLVEMLLPRKTSDICVAMLLKNIRMIFGDRQLDEQIPGDREFAAAANSILKFFKNTNKHQVENFLNQKELFHLFSVLFQNVSYQLEQESEDAILTEGWLELQWTDAQELVLTGFVENNIPDAITIHPFLSDLIRSKLKLTSNAERTSRDVFLLSEFVKSRQPNAVQIFLHRFNDNKEACKPSRLLFFCSDEILLARVKKMFSMSETEQSVGEHTFPDAWKLELPIPPENFELPRIRSTQLESYLQCPFAYYLTNVLGMEPVMENTELQANDFGTICHDALEAFAKSSLKNSSDEYEISDFLKSEVEKIFTRKYGSSRFVVLELQKKAICERLDFFAKVQAKHRKKDWEIIASELKCEIEVDGVTISGTIDRVDRREVDGKIELAVFDYKTWDKIGEMDFFSTNKKQLEFAEERNLPILERTKLTRSGDAKTIPCVWRHLQLPLYCKMLKIKYPEAQNILCGYIVIAKNETNSSFGEPVGFSENELRNFDETVSLLLKKLRAGIFWKPNPTNAKLFNFKKIFDLENPLGSINEKWIENQEKRNGK